MKLNSINIWLTKSFDLGETLGELDIADVFGHKQAIAYYESGVAEFDKIFKPDGYVKNGYVATLLARENGVSLILVKFSGSDVNDIGFAHINREDIINSEEVEAENLEIVQKEEVKHKAKYMMKRGTGLLGAVTGLVTEKFVSANTLTSLRALSSF